MKKLIVILMLCLFLGCTASSQYVQTPEQQKKMEEFWYEDMAPLHIIFGIATDIGAL